VVVYAVTVDAVRYDVAAQKENTIYLKTDAYPIKKVLYKNCGYFHNNPYCALA